jgi:SAM-dependent methyltransferase
MTVSACRSCGATPLKSILSLGHTPLANALLTEAQLQEPEVRYPLDLVFCPNCTLVQITETVPPEQLFREYVYFSSFADASLQNAQAIVKRLIASRHLGDHSLAVEIASNDGYLLQYYHRANIPVLGIEPALNIAKVAESRGIHTLPDFFSEALARQLLEQKLGADVIHANNVLAHVADLNGVVAGLGLLLKPQGVVVIEVPYLKDLIDFVEFDTIYHEHLCYFSLTALTQLFHRHGLSVQEVERLPIHGGSLRLFVGHGHFQTAAVRDLLAVEADWGITRFEAYQDFGRRVEKLKTDLVTFLHRVKAQGQRVAAYGASAKGATLLNYFGIGRETLEFVVDRSSVKQGLYTPGTHLPIYAPEKLLEDKPHYALLLTWNFADEIIAQQAAYRRQGGRFIIPVPEVRVI